MKNLTLLLILSLCFAFSSCKDNSVSSAECTPVVEAMFENLKKMAPADAQEQVDQKKAMLIPVLQKECEKGVYDLNCLKNAKDIASLQLCKK
ncbi:MAG: TIGR04454 family lipoprotein [Leptospiraceae bacterium]|nr:TIGR04454 family lipoprotein [Leptospiraceae bacterium]